MSVERNDSLDHPACKEVHSAWNEYGSALGGEDVRDYLLRSFFSFHRRIYENRPIYFPLSSAQRSFVALVSVHRWAGDTLSILLAEHLLPAKRRLVGELNDLRLARGAAGSKPKTERRYAALQKLGEELDAFIASVEQVASGGPSQPDDVTPGREVDAAFSLDLDDGVMINSAALWQLLEPQWKDPKKWWTELATAQGKKDYDWSNIAARYFPVRVREKCQDDPSLAVAHRCFWALHPAKAYEWELRLKEEIGPSFKIDEPGSDEARATFLSKYQSEARAIEAKELKRRERKASKSGDDADAQLSLGGTEKDAVEEADG